MGKWNTRFVRAPYQSKSDRGGGKKGELKGHADLKMLGGTE